MCTQKMRALSYIGAEKITFPPKPTDIHTDGRTDISIYRVASLLINYLSIHLFTRTTLNILVIKTKETTKN